MDKIMMRKYQSRSIKTVKSELRKEFGKQQCNRILQKVDKLIVIVTPRVLKPVYRYLRQLNTVNNSEVYNNKTFHMVFSKEKKEASEIASTILKSMFFKIKKHKNHIIEGLGTKDAFGEVKQLIDSMEWSCTKLQKYYNELSGEYLIYNRKKFENEFDDMIHKIGINIINSGKRGDFFK